MKKVILFIALIVNLHVVNSQIQTLPINLNWNITEYQLSKTDSIDIDGDGIPNLLIHSFFYDLWNGIEVLSVDYDGNFTTETWVRVVNESSNLTVQDCDISGSIQKSISGYIYTDQLNHTTHQNKTIQVPLMMETINGLRCGNLLVEYSGNNIIVHSVTFNSSGSSNCNCSLGLNELPYTRSEREVFNLMGQPAQKDGLVIQNGELKYFQLD